MAREAPLNTAGTTQLDILLDDVAPDLSATQKVRMEQQSLKPGGLIAGAYYKGYLGPTEAIARWNGPQLASSFGSRPRTNAG